MNGKTGVCMCVCVCVHYDRLVYRISYNRVVHTVYSGYYNSGPLSDLITVGLPKRPKCISKHLHACSAVASGTA